MKFYNFLRPALFLAPAEWVHNLTIFLLRLIQNFLPKPSLDDERLHIKTLGCDFSNPIGLAAGFDKNAEVPTAILKLGFGFCEVGTLTPLPQKGHPRPRLFRLPQKEALINRLGFNNKGFALAKHRLSVRPCFGVIGVNVGANKKSPHPISDYEKGVVCFEGLADYFTLNISSPNTKGLRALQHPEPLLEMVKRVKARASQKPILLKLSPDLTPSACKAIAAIAMAEKIDGLIIANTTIDRQCLGLDEDMLREKMLKKNMLREKMLGKEMSREEMLRREGLWEGGLSGKPLFAHSTNLLKDFYRHTKGELTLIGVGGIASARDVYEKIKAGASLVQLYTALVYQGPALLWQMKKELIDLLDKDGLSSISEAIGKDVEL